MENKSSILDPQKTAHTLIEGLPDSEITAAVRFLQFIHAQHAIEEVDDPDDVRIAQEALANPERFSLDSVLKEAGL